MLRLILIITMALKFYLRDNPLTPDPDDLRAATVKGKANDLEDIIDMMMHRPVGVSRVEVAGVMEELFIAMEFLLLRGEHIVTPLFRITPLVNGVFESEETPFDRTRHLVKLKLLPGKRLEQIAAEIPVEKVEPVVIVPKPVSVLDMAANVKNQSLTPGQPARIIGNRLKFEEADPLQGVFLIDTANEAETKVNFFLDNKPKTVTFIVPDPLPAGSYELQLRSNMGTKELREGSLSQTLTVT